MGPRHLFKAFQEDKTDGDRAALDNCDEDLERTFEGPGKSALQGAGASCFDHYFIASQLIKCTLSADKDHTKLYQMADCIPFKVVVKQSTGPNHG